MIGIGSDHGGFHLKQTIIQHLNEKGYEVKDYGSNILALGERVVGKGLALDIVDTFLEAEFSSDGRHIRRIEMIENAGNENE